MTKKKSDGGKRWTRGAQSQERCVIFRKGQSLEKSIDEGWRCFQFIEGFVEGHRRLCRLEGRDDSLWRVGPECT